MRESAILAAPQGFEPRYAAPEAAVLPLNEGATRALIPLLLPDWRGPRQDADHQANLFIIRGLSRFGQPRLKKVGDLAHPVAPPALA